MSLAALMTDAAWGSGRVPTVVDDAIGSDVYFGGRRWVRSANRALRS